MIWMAHRLDENGKQQCGGSHNHIIKLKTIRGVIHRMLNCVDNKGTWQITRCNGDVFSYDKKDWKPVEKITITENSIKVI